MSECVDQDESGLLCTLLAGHDGDHVATGGPGMVLASWPRIADAGAVMSEWRGLHNPERHEAFTVGGANPCVSCNLLCDSEWPCRCCLAAEVERLTERIALAVAFCDEFSGVQVAVTTARILRGES